MTFILEKIMRLFIYVFLALVAIFLLGFCTLDTPQAAMMLKKLNDKFDAGETSVKLSDVSPVVWDKFCFFLYADSAPADHAYKIYSDYLSENKIEQNNLKKQKYRMIFLFQKNDQYTALGFSQSYIKVNGVTAWFMPEASSSGKSYQCLQKSVSFNLQYYNYASGKEAYIVVK